MLTPHSPCHFISRALIPYAAQMKWSCVKGRPETVDGVPRAGSRRLIRLDVLRGQGAVIRICTCGRRAVKARNLR